MRRASGVGVIPPENAGVAKVLDSRIEYADPAALLTPSAGKMDLPVIKFSVQPAVRGRRASRLMQAPKNDEELSGIITDAHNIRSSGASQGGERGRRRSSVLLAEAVSSSTLSLPDLISIVNSSVIMGDVKRVVESIASLGHLAMRANSAVYSEAHQLGAFNHQKQDVTREEAGVTVSLGASGAVEAILRALNRMGNDRELVLRSLWALVHILQTWDNKQMFRSADGLSTLKSLQGYHRWDKAILSAILEVRMLVERHFAGPIECCMCWGYLCTCSCLPLACVSLHTHCGMVLSNEASCCPIFPLDEATVAPEPEADSLTGKAKKGMSNSAAGGNQNSTAFHKDGEVKRSLFFAPQQVDGSGSTTGADASGSAPKVRNLTADPNSGSVVGVNKPIVEHIGSTTSGSAPSEGSTRNLSVGSALSGHSSMGSAVPNSEIEHEGFSKKFGGLLFGNGKTKTDAQSDLVLHHGDSLATMKATAQRRRASIVQAQQKFLEESNAPTNDDN